MTRKLTYVAVLLLLTVMASATVTTAQTSATIKIAIVYTSGTSVPSMANCV